MIFLFFAVIFLLLLMLLKESVGKLHPLLMVIFFFILFQAVVLQQLIPFLTGLQQLITDLPYGTELIFTALLLLLGQHFSMLFEEQDYDAIAELVKTSVRITLLSFWLLQLTPVFRQLMSLFERLQ
ncbi:pyruvate formate-lyase [Solibacillus sp. FSL H8-0538]|uniref:pyruvate formate-lyase n=1 Tax=Solibacillus sp. FSL H8-0538 TaxID=2921400 RepID=UPI0030F7E8C9